MWKQCTYEVSRLEEAVDDASPGLPGSADDECGGFVGSHIFTGVSRFALCECKEALFTLK